MLRLVVTADVVPSSPILVTLMMEAVRFFRNVGSHKSDTANNKGHGIRKALYCLYFLSCK
jgi:hypothetical protein